MLREAFVVGVVATVLAACGGGGSGPSVETVSDTTAPKISLPDSIDNGVLRLAVGSIFNFPSVTAIDDQDGDLTNSISITLTDGSGNPVNLVDTNAPGAYIMLYSVKDKAGNVARETVSVEIVAVPPAVNKPPVINPELTASSKSTSSIELMWKAASDQDDDSLQYRILRDGVYVDSIISSKASGEDLKYTDSGLQAFTTHIYRVEVFDSRGSSDSTNSRAQRTKSCFTTALGIQQPATSNGEQNLIYLTAKYTNYKAELLPDTDAAGRYEDHSYYKTVDPSARKRTLDAWLRQHGFLQTGAPLMNRKIRREWLSNNVLNAEYVNAYDLGFGRDMYCLGSNAPDADSYACVVQNYRVAENLSMASKECGPEFLLSVAMEWDAQNQITAFYVYDELGRRVNRVDLDGYGAKSVPQVCVACHDGEYTKSVGEGSIRRGEYLPFDPSLFLGFSRDPGFRYSPQVSTKADFTDLNKRIKSLDESRSDAALFDEIISADGTVKSETMMKRYNLGITIQGPYIKLYGPGHEDGSMQTEFYERYCRTCHIAQRDAFAVKQYDIDAAYKDGFNCMLCHDSHDGGNAYTVIDVNGQPKLIDQLKPLRDTLCANQLNSTVMPNARMTHEALHFAIAGTAPYDQTDAQAQALAIIKSLCDDKGFSIKAVVK